MTLLGLLAGCDQVFGLDRSVDASTDTGDGDLLVWYPMDDDPLIGVIDASGNGRDGLCVTTSCPVVDVGARGGGYRFDGGDVIRIVDGTSLGPDAATIALWIRFDGPPVDGTVMSKPLGSNKVDSWELYVTPPNLYLGTSVAAPLVVPWSAAAGKWTHVAITYQASMTRLYLDGLPAGQMNATMTFDDNPVIIGADQDAGTIVSNEICVLDDVRIYRRVLDASEIAELARP